jgi:hypothetical protein
MKNLMRFLLLFIFVGMSLSTQAQDDLLSRINGLRASLGLPAYRTNGALAGAASQHARWMVDTSQVSHIQSDGSSPRDRARANGYTSAWVSENIYMGTSASIDSAWNFWVNSPIHYAGLTSPNYDEIGIGTASGAGGNAFVLVFGNSSGAVRAVNPAPSGNNSSGGGARPQPSFVVGLDANGNIMHEVQPNDTLGEIMLIYGYSWDMIPYVLTLNGMTQADVRRLKVGSVLLIPPKGSTFTPSPIPSEAPTHTPPPPTSTQPTALPTLDPLPPPVVFNPATPTPTLTPTLTPSPTPEPLVIRTLPPSTAVASVATSVPPAPLQEATRQEGIPAWLWGAIAVQVCILGYATWSYFKRR